MTSIRGYVDYLLLEPDRLDPQELECLQIVQKNARLLVDLVNDLLDLSGLEEGKVELRRSVFDLMELVQDLVQSFQPQLRVKEQTLSTSAPTAPLFILADPQRIAQVLTNLLSNTSKFTPIGGSVTIALESEKGQVRISVSDTGIGKDEGYSVQTGLDGQCLQNLQRDLPNLILLDIMLEGEDGRDLWAQLKQREATRHIPIITYLVGASTFLPKPFEIDDLINTTGHPSRPRRSLPTGWHAALPLPAEWLLCGPGFPAGHRAHPGARACGHCVGQGRDILVLVGHLPLEQLVCLLHLDEVRHAHTQFLGVKGLHQVILRSRMQQLDTKRVIGSPRE